MFHKPVFGGRPQRKWKYIGYVYPNNTVVTIDDTSKVHRIVAINYCTANGTATTTDTVNVDSPIASASPVGGSSQVFGYLYQDNLGDEGTGYEVMIHDIPTGNTTVTIAAQTVEDYYWGMALIFQEVPGFTDPLVAKSFTASRTDVPGEGGYTVTNPAIAHWSISEAGTVSLSENAHTDGVIGGFSNDSSAIVVFYHGYGTSYSPTSASPDFANFNFCRMRKAAGVPGVYHPEEAKIVYDPTVDAGSGSLAIAVVFDGTVYDNLSEIVYVTNEQFSQGDNMFAVMF